MELREVLLRGGEVTADNLGEVRNHLIVRIDLISISWNSAPSGARDVPWIRIDAERSNIHTCGDPHVADTHARLSSTQGEGGQIRIAECVNVDVFVDVFWGQQ
jgi:hypothetical protein